MAIERTEIPTDDALSNALSELRLEHAALGAAKLHATLLEQQPSWTVSEKRTRKVLQAAGLSLPAPTSTDPDGATTKNPNATNTNGTPATALSKKKKKAGAGANARVYPASQLTSKLDVSAFSPKVTVHQFGGGKGKGLVATSDIAQGEVLWKEDPWALAAEWEIFDLQMQGQACSHCSTPFASQVSASPFACPNVQPSFPLSSNHCPALFCNRLCLSRAETYHALLCQVKNPAGAHALLWARKREWIAPHALAKSYARLLLSYANGSKDDWERDLGIWNGLACLSMEERAKDQYFVGGSEVDPDAWKAAQAVLIDAFAPEEEKAKKRIGRILKKRLPKEIERSMFSYEGVCKGLGKINLNLEAHGGLYTLHSHINHGCAPNLSVRHRDQRTALSRIAVEARRDIAKGEELTITYVNPTMPVRARRQELAAWGFGECMCERCVEEEKEAKMNGTWTAEGGAGLVGGGMDLARELKSGFGLL